jgi:mono/diheme cytochrome c family protein
MPDAALFDAARGGRLSTPPEIEAEARRMIADPKLRRMMVEYHRQWLDLDRLDRAVKDAALYPSYTAALKSAIREESDRFVLQTMVDGDGTLRSLLSDNTTYVNAALAAHYGVPAPASGWAKATLDPLQRAGFLTRANFLASHAHATSGSPPLRAVFIMRRLLCQALPPPPNDADLTPPQPKPGDAPKTNRQLFAARTAGSCQSCHGAIDGLGFGLENYDAIGRYRTTDNGLTVDATGTLSGVDVAGPFTGGVELSRRLAESADVRRCAATKWYEFAAGRDKVASDDCRIAAMDRALTAADGDVREMLVALVLSPDFLTRPATGP